MTQVPLLILTMLTLFFPSMLRTEQWTIVGEEAESIMKYGAILDTRCKSIDEMQWKFCTSSVELQEGATHLIGWEGIWECSLHHNYAGHQVNVMCLRQYPRNQSDNAYNRRPTRQEVLPVKELKTATPFVPKTDDSNLRERLTSTQKQKTPLVKRPSLLFQRSLRAKDLTMKFGKQPPLYHLVTQVLF